MKSFFHPLNKAKALLLLMALGLGIPSLGSAQFTFQRKIDPDPSLVETANSVVESTGGGYFLVGDMPNSGTLPGQDVYVIKTDIQGNLDWSFVYEVSNIDLTGAGVAEANSGECVVAGTAIDAGDNDVFAFRLNSTGGIIWDMFYDYGLTNWVPEAHNIKREIISGNEYFLITGGITPPSGGAWLHGLFLLQVDAGGTKQWSFDFTHYNSYTRAVEVEPCSFGYYVLLEDFTAGGTGSAYYVAGIFMGTTPSVWMRRVVWPGISSATDLAVVDGDDVILSGSVLNPTTQDWDVGVTRLNWAAPNYMGQAWGYLDERPGDQFSPSSALSVNGDLGILINDVSSGDAEILNIDPASGNLNWKERYTGFGLFDGSDMEATNDGGFVAEGYDGTAANLLKVDQAGSSGCFQEASVFNRVNETLPLSLTFLGHGDIFVDQTISFNSEDLTPLNENICCSFPTACIAGPTRASYNRQVTINPDDQNAYALDILENGDHIIVGTNNQAPSGSRDNLLVNTDGEGNLCRIVDIDHGEDEWYLGVYQRTAGCKEYFTTGFEFTSGGDMDVFVSMHDPMTGVPIWTTRLDNQSQWEQGYDMVEHQIVNGPGNVDNYIFTSGFTQSFGSGQDDGLLLNIRDDGAMISSNALGWSGVDRFHAITKNTTDPLIGTPVMVGHSQGANGTGTADAWILRTAVSAVPIASRVFGYSTGDDIAQDVVRGPNGNYYVVGQAREFNTDPWDIFVARFDASFNLIYYNVFQEPDEDIAFAVDYNTDNDMLYIVGHSVSHSFFGNKAAVVLEVEPLSGQFQRAVMFDEHEDESFADVKVDSDGRVVCVGYSRSFNPADAEVYMVKLDNMDAPCKWDIAFQDNYVVEPVDNTLPGRVSNLLAVSVPTIEYLIDEEAWDVCPYNGPTPPPVGGNQPEDIFAKQSLQNMEISLAPNPASHRVDLSYRFASESPRKVEILDLQGRVLLSQSLHETSGTQSLSLDDLSRGIYLVRISGGPEGQVVKRLSVQ